MSLLAHNNTSVTLYSDDSDDPDYLEKHTVSDADAAVSESSSQLESISPIAKPKPRTDQQILRLPAIAPAVAIASQEPKMRGRPRKLAPSIQDRPSDGSESAGPGRLASRAMSDDSDADSAVLESPSRTVPVRPNIKLTTVRGRPRLQDITPVTSNTISAPRPRGRPWKSAPPVISLYPLFRIHYQPSILLIAVPELACRSRIAFSSLIKATLRLIAPTFQESINVLAPAQAFYPIQPGLLRFFSRISGWSRQRAPRISVETDSYDDEAPELSFSKPRHAVSHITPTTRWIPSSALIPCLLSQQPLLSPCFPQKGGTLYV